MAGLLVGLLGKATTFVRNIVQDVKTGRDATAAGFVSGLTTPQQQQTLTSSANTSSGIGGVSWVMIGAVIGGGIILALLWKFISKIFK